MLSGGLLLLPRLSNWITVSLLAAYLLYVPMKIFHRMELPVHDLSMLQDGAPELTALFIVCAYLLIFLFTQNTAAGLGAGSGFFLILFLVVSAGGNTGVQRSGLAALLSISYGAA